MGVIKTDILSSENQMTVNRSTIIKDSLSPGAVNKIFGGQEQRR